VVRCLETERKLPQVQDLYDMMDKEHAQRKSDEPDSRKTTTGEQACTG
jgi:hypothetical protein